jgi:hypothetical protein
VSVLGPQAPMSVGLSAAAHVCIACLLCGPGMSVSSTSCPVLGTHCGVVHVADAEVACGVQLGLLCTCHLLAGGGVNTSQHSVAMLRVRLRTGAIILLRCWGPGAAACRVCTAAAAADLLPVCCSFGLPQPRLEVAVCIAALQCCTAATDRV